MKHLLKLILALSFLGSTFPVKAAEYNVGDACGVAGAFQTKNSTDQVEILLCDGSNWVRSGVFRTSVMSLGANAANSYTNSLDKFAFGYNALNSALTNGPSIVMGANAAQIMTNAGGSSPMTIGYDVASDLTSVGNRTMIIGTEAGQGNSTLGGNETIVIGYRARQNLSNGTNTVTIGSNAGQSMENAGSSVVVGAYAGVSNVAANPATGASSVIIGYGAGASLNGPFNTQAMENVFLGYQAGNATTTGTDNIIIGYDVDASAAGASSELNIGNLIYGDLANGFFGIGKVSPAVALDVSGDVEYTGRVTDVSDHRLKESITLIKNGLDGIRKINGVSFIMKNNPDKDVEFGLIAQDVAKEFPELVHKTHNGFMALNYQGMVAPMIAAMQELDAENKKLENDIEKLLSKLERLEVNRLSRFKNMTGENK